MICDFGIILDCLEYVWVSDVVVLRVIFLLRSFFFVVIKLN